MAISKLLSIRFLYFVNIARTINLNSITRDIIDDIAKVDIILD